MADNNGGPAAGSGNFRHRTFRRPHKISPQHQILRRIPAHRHLRKRHQVATLTLGARGGGKNFFRIAANVAHQKILLGEGEGEGFWHNRGRRV